MLAIQYNIKKLSQKKVFCGSNVAYPNTQIQHKLYLMIIITSWTSSEKEVKDKAKYIAVGTFLLLLWRAL